MRELALEYPRFGYRRIGVMLRREGRVLNAKKQASVLPPRKLKRRRIQRRPAPLERLRELNQERRMATYVTRRRLPADHFQSLRLSRLASMSLRLRQTGRISLREARGS